MSVLVYNVNVHKQQYCRSRWISTRCFEKLRLVRDIIIRTRLGTTDCINITVFSETCTVGTESVACKLIVNFN